MVSRVQGTGEGGHPVPQSSPVLARVSGKRVQGTGKFGVICILGIFFS